MSLTFRHFPPQSINLEQQLSSAHRLGVSSVVVPQGLTLSAARQHPNGRNSLLLVSDGLIGKIQACQTRVKDSSLFQVYGASFFAVDRSAVFWTQFVAIFLITEGSAWSLIKAVVSLVPNHKPAFSPVVL